MLPKRWKNAHILLKSQESAQHCWEFKIVLQIRKSAEKVPRAIGTCLLLGTKYVRERIPKYSARTSSQDSCHDVY